MKPQQTEQKPSPAQAAPPAAQPPKKAAGGLKFTLKQFRLILLGFLGLMAIIFIATIYIGMGKLSHKSQELVAAKLKDKTLDAQLTSLEIAKKQVQKYGYFNDVAQTVIPNDKDQAQAVLDITRLANESGIAIASITFPNSTLGGTSGTASATSTKSTLNTVSQGVPVAGISGLYSVSLTITPQIGQQVPSAKMSTYPKLLNFLSKIEHDRRTAQIAQVSVQPVTDASGPTGELNFTLVINIFIRPATK